MPAIKVWLIACCIFLLGYFTRVAQQRMNQLLQAKEQRRQAKKPWRPRASLPAKKRL
jgi:hypothetical protein